MINRLCKVLVAISFVSAYTSAAYASATGCMLKPISTVDIRSPVVGRLSQVHVQRGSRVRQGAVLATLDSTVETAAAESARYRSQTQAQIIAAQNKVMAAQRKVERMKILYDAEFMSAQALDDANNELKIAQAELNAAIEAKTLAEYEYKSTLTELNRRTIVSPISGVVTVRYLEPGSMVSPTDGEKPIMTIAKTDRLKVEMILPVRMFNQYRVGSRITITPEAPFNSPIQTTVSVKDNTIDAASGTFSMLAYINNSNYRIPSGILCSIS